ncbi:hypothetical protein GCM10009645_36670 [Mycolicibacterium poriferae]|uniref:Uncharacterized protein n=1 Tax=Mycolicibacterium poriferae TaxID=39694 RepID=A0A6N4V894_9MYCO|nr:hypothetical protein MPOR_13860 [Mycolicibacterium poriferae]
MIRIPYGLGSIDAVAEIAILALTNSYNILGKDARVRVALVLVECVAPIE